MCLGVAVFITAADTHAPRQHGASSARLQGESCLCCSASLFMHGHVTCGSAEEAFHGQIGADRWNPSNVGHKLWSWCNLIVFVFGFIDVDINNSARECARRTAMWICLVAWKCRQGGGQGGDRLDRDSWTHVCYWKEDSGDEWNGRGSWCREIVITADMVSVSSWASY